MSGSLSILIPCGTSGSLGWACPQLLGCNILLSPTSPSPKASRSVAVRTPVLGGFHSRPRATGVRVQSSVTHHVCALAKTGSDSRHFSFEEEMGRNGCAGLAHFKRLSGFFIH